MKIEAAPLGLLFWFFGLVCSTPQKNVSSDRCWFRIPLIQLEASWNPVTKGERSASPETFFCSVGAKRTKQKQPRPPADFI
ncbi:hypothetical protein [Paenibacillus catalpae]|uniref:hypothetical protein n=1 Tax=Paenibacillus catalpae TaxID=1045775 RepID=UPI001C31AA3F|nr:hypothetical protein [Paenibacillus catalpae]